MSYDGNGTYSLLYTWATEAASPPIAISKLDTEMAGIAAGLTKCLLRDGTGVPSADTPWNSKKITNLANATADADALNRVTADGRYLALAGGTLSGPVVCADQVVSRPELKDYAETVKSTSISTGALALDYTEGNYHYVTLNANVTSFSITNPPATGKLGSITVEFIADGTLRTITWGSSVKWPGGSAPTMTSTLNKKDFVTLITRDAGTTWYASISQNY